MSPPRLRSGPSLRATYRLQLHKGFDLARARAVVPYLERLGVSHVYASPVLRARGGSTHGYDVADPSLVSPELGTLDDLRALAGDLHARGMGLVVDIVPNHMGIGPENPYWEDVLAHGASSRWARWFDIDWKAGRKKVVLPVLGDELDAVLARGELTLDVSERGARLRYFDSSFPLDPATLPETTQLAQWDPEAPRAEGDDASAFATRSLGTAGLRALVEAQHYRLVFWKRGPREINYRRFFDVNELVSLRMEDPEVFAETHALVLQLVREGVIDGLRIDHVDGLLDPQAYLERLRAAVGADVPILVEKILSPGETLRESWPVQGTTGYEFLNDLEDVFLDPAGYAEVERCYRALRRLSGAGTAFEDVAWQGKVKVLTGPLQADVARLARLLQPHAAAASELGAWTYAQLADAIVRFIAAMPVYRTYLDGRGEPHPDDVAVIETARRRARERATDEASRTATDLVADVLVDSLPFVSRFQQVSGPATAKGVEDTALYVYVPLASRNEVGGAPDRALDDAVGRLHAANALRAERWPSALLCTNTHDTKRTADLRARLDVLSECHGEWRRSLGRWRRLNHKHRTVVNGRLAPDTNTEYLFYQTLVGMWPAPRPGRRVDDVPDREWRRQARERIEQYMLKAVKEAKVRTSWTEPDAAYEDALKAFVAAVLEASDDAPFLSDVARFVSRVAGAGLWTALSRVLVHLTAPGVPDLYQGDELWYVALVDPDNRRPVDYERRRTLLAELDHVDVAALARDPADARLKLWLTRQLLHARRRDPDLWTRGDYRPLVVRGAGARHLVAYARSAGARRAVVLAPRLLASLQLAGREASAVWGDTTVVLPPDWGGVRWQSALDGSAVPPADDGGGELRAATLLSPLPLALLVGG